MKILELNFARAWRGGERQTLYNCQGFIAENHQVKLICRQGSVLAKKAADSGIPVLTFKNIPALILYLVFKGHKYEILHAQTSHILTYCVLTKPFHGCKIIFTRRIDFVPRGFITRLKYQLADYRVGVSTAVAGIVEKFSQRPATMISDIAVENKLDKVRAENWLELRGINKSKTIIATTAALVQHKDPLTLVNAIALLATQNADFIFLHFGTGDLEEAVTARIKSSGLEKIYLLAGFEDSVEDFFSIFDIFVMSSEEEGLGSSVLDAFLYQVPVVSTNAGGLKDLLADGRGQVCSIHDERGLADGIICLLAEDSKTALSLQRAREFVLSKHSMQYITRQYLDLINLTPISPQ